METEGAVGVVEEHGDSQKDVDVKESKLTELKEPGNANIVAENISAVGDGELKSVEPAVESVECVQPVAENVSTSEVLAQASVTPAEGTGETTEELSTPEGKDLTSDCAVSDDDAYEDAEDAYNESQELLEACKLGDVERALEILELAPPGLDVNLHDKLGRTALIVSCYEGHAAIVQKLVTLPEIDVTRPDRNDVLPIFAALQSSIPIVQILLAHKPELHIPAALKPNAFLAVCGKTELLEESVMMRVAESLLDDVDVQELVSTSVPLHLAAETRNHSIMEILIGAGGDVNTRDDDGYTPLAVSCDVDDVTFVRRLLDAGADPNLTTAAGISPLSLACRSDPAVTAALLQAGADPNVPDSTSASPLHYACIENRHDIVELLIPLLSHQALNAPLANGHTPLMIAADRGHDEILASLLASPGTEPGFNTVDGGSFRAIHCAAESGNSLANSLLLEAGADPTAATGAGNTALHLAAKAGHWETCAVLLKAGVDPDLRTACPVGCTPLMLAARQCHLEAMQVLLAGGADINALDGYNMPAILQAGIFKVADSVCFLLGAGADLSARSNKFNLNFLHVACRLGNVNLIRYALFKFAIASPAGPYEVGEDSWDSRLTPLHIAVIEEHVDAAALLLGVAGIEVDAASLDGTTPLWYAAKNGNEALVEMLLLAGADPRLTDKTGSTPLHQACWNGTSGRCIELLLPVSDLNAVVNLKLQKTASQESTEIREDVVIEEEYIEKTEDDGDEDKSESDEVEGKTNMVSIDESGPVKTEPTEPEPDSHPIDKDENEIEVPEAGVDGTSGTPKPAETSQANEVKTENKAVIDKGDEASERKVDAGESKVEDDHDEEKKLTAEQNDEERAEDSNDNRVKAESDKDEEENVTVGESEDAEDSDEDEDDDDDRAMSYWDGATPIFVAVCNSKSPSAVSALVHSGCDVNIANAAGLTPLMLACYLGHQSIVKILLECACTDVTLCDVNGRQAVHFCAYLENAPVISHLLHRGADINSRCITGETALSIAKSSIPCNQVFVQFLLDNGARDTDSDDTTED